MACWVFVDVGEGCEAPLVGVGMCRGSHAVGEGNFGTWIETVGDETER